MRRAVVICSLLGVTFLVALARVADPSAPIDRPRMADPATSAARSVKSPVLRGAGAIEHLKQQGTYDSLADAVTRARYSVTRAQGPAVANAEATYEALNPAKDLQASFSGTAVRVRSSGDRKWQLGLELKGYGYGEHLLGLASGEMAVRDNRIEISKHAVGSPEAAALVEWYVNTPQGLEQGFTLPAPPDRAAARPAAGDVSRSGSADWLRLTLELSGDVRGELSADGQAVRFKDRSGRHVASYDHFEAWDATGRELAARMAVRGRQVSLEVDDRGAQYPIVVDPLVWQETTPLLGDPFALDQVGHSVAISGDTAIVGCNHVQNTTNGKVFVFVRKRTAWTEQSTWEYQATLEAPAPTSHYGISVAISGDTAIVGDDLGSFDFNESFGKGAAYIFQRNGSAWVLRKRIVASDSHTGNGFGAAVAISGETAVVGAPTHGVFVHTANRGKAYVFVSDGGAWNQQKELEPDDGLSEDQFGTSVAVSGDTAIVGAPYHDVTSGGVTNPGQGQAYVFVRAGGNWSVGTRLVGSIGAPFDRFGYSVALSRNTAVIGAYGADQPPAVGLAYVFGWNGAAWSEQQILVADDGQPRNAFGFSVAIAGDTVVVGAPFASIAAKERQGAAYVFGRDGAVWKQRDKLIASDGEARDVFGISVAVGGVGLIVGAPGHDVAGRENQGQAYIFQQLDGDGDGLPDEWEKKGVHLEGSFIDLPAMGADPRHKDIFVHVNWMATGPNGAVLKPSARAIKMVTDAFAASPITNPDLKKGVRLHVDLGPNSVMNSRTGAKWGTLSRAGEVPFQETLGSFSAPPEPRYDWTEFAEIKKAFFDALHRGPVFHHALFCNTLPDVLLLQRPIRGNARGAPSADFLVALGAFKKSNGAAGTPLQQALTFMHELGHNLGLEHGGGERVNYKPNYLSVMNYRFDSAGLLSGRGQQRKLDYSRSVLATLNETNLDEAIGIGDPAGHLTTWNPITGETTLRTTPPGFNRCLTNPNGYWKIFLPGPALDWDCNGMLTPPSEGPIIEDINSDGRCIAPGRDQADNDLPLETTEAFLQGDDEIRAGFVTSGPDRICQTPKHGFNDVPLQEVGFAQPDELTGFDDWRALKFDGGGKVGASLGEIDTDPLNTLLDESPTERVVEDVPAALVAEDEAAPLDEVTYAPQEGPAALAVAFDASGSTAVTGTIVDWVWDFGDGTTGSGAIVTHTYDTPGEYYASVTVTDGSGRVNLVPLLNLITVNEALPTPTPTPSPTPVPTLTPVRTPTPVATPTPIRTPTPVPMVGDVDATFNATVTSRHGDHANALVTQPDGRTIAGGSFASFGGQARRNIARINPDGSCDPSFDPGLVLTDLLKNNIAAQNTTRVSLDVYALALQPDGKVLVGVQAQRGFKGAVATTTEMIFRLNWDGTRDPTFDASGSFATGTPRVTAIVVQPDGKVLVGGDFVYGAGGSRRGIARLNADGSIDSSFTLAQGTPNNVGAIALQPDGKIVISGNLVSIGKIAIARLTPDGSVDAAFNMTGPTSSRLDTNTSIQALALQPDGKLVLAGRLFDTTVPANPTLIPFARLNADGSRDSSFSITFDASVFAAAGSSLALQEDGKIVVGGVFRSTNPVLRHGLARLNADGTLDASFDTGSGTSGPGRDVGVAAVALHGDGKVVASGDFDQFNGAPAVEGIVQLDADGSHDQTFAWNGAGQSARVYALRRQPDGKVLVGFYPDGEIMKLNSAWRGGIGRLEPDGTTDTTFASPFVLGSAVDDILLQADGKVIIIGSLRAIASPLVEIQAARLDADGTLDTTFQPAGRPLAVLPDGKMLASAAIPFSLATELVRLDPDGGRDDTFTPHFFANGGADTLVVQPDGRMIIAGLFRLDDAREARIARLDADGRFDTTFDPGTGPNNTVRALVLQPDGKIIIGGQFSSYDGTARNRIARLHADGSLDTSFDPFNPSDRNVGALALQPDGKIVVGIQHHDNDPSFTLSPIRVFRLDSGGPLDSSFPIANGGIEPVNGAVNALFIQPDGDIVIGGIFEVVNGLPRLALARLVGQIRASSTPTPIPTPTPASTATPTAAPSPSPTASPNPSPAPSPEPTPTPVPTATSSPTPTGSPSPAPSPSSTPTASPARPLQTVECYRARGRNGTPRFQPIAGVQLDDGIESILVRIEREFSLCNDVSVDRGTALESRVGVLACYHLERVAGDEWARPPGLTIANRFGEQRIEFVFGSSERTLCVPARGALTSRADDAVDPPSGLDRLRCRRVRAKPLRPTPELVLGDAFETKRMRVRSIRSLCAPVALDGDTPAGDDLLACYNVAQAPGQRGFRPPGEIEIESELASQTLDVRNAQRTLCVPTERR